MAHTLIYEFDALVAAAAGVTDGVGLRTVPPQVFAWLEAQALRLAHLVLVAGPDDLDRICCHGDAVRVGAGRWAAGARGCVGQGRCHCG